MPNSRLWDPLWHTLALWLALMSACAGGEGSAQPDSSMRRDAGVEVAESSVQEPDASTRELCAWGVDDLLREAGASAPHRRNCGSYPQWTSGFAGVWGCFEAAVAEGTGVQLTINRCVDCSIPTTYVATDAGGRFAVRLEDDAFGDGQRVAAIDACDAITFDATTQDIVCNGAAELYSCSESRQNPRLVSKDPPVTPFKLSDVPLSADQSSTLLHLYISNQSFDDALIPLNVSIDGLHVVTGDFAVGNQHNWQLFDIKLPAGMHSLMASSGSTRNSAHLMQTIDVPSERWVVLDYWYAVGDPEREHFTLAASSQPVAFD